MIKINATIGKITKSDISTPIVAQLWLPIDHTPHAAVQRRIADMAKKNMELKRAKDVNTAAVVATGLIGGWLTARETGIRPLGGVILAAAGGYAARSWNAKAGAGVASALTAGYIGAFGASHPLAKKMGSWPAVLTVTAATAGAAWAASDRL